MTFPSGWMSPWECVQCLWAGPYGRVWPSVFDESLCTGTRISVDPDTHWWLTATGLFPLQYRERSVPSSHSPCCQSVSECMGCVWSGRGQSRWRTPPPPQRPLPWFCDSQPEICSLMLCMIHRPSCWWRCSKPASEPGCPRKPPASHDESTTGNSHKGLDIQCLPGQTVQMFKCCCSL